MKAYQFIICALLAVLTGCYVMDVPQPETPSPAIRLTLDDDPFSATEPVSIGYEQSQTLSFEYEDISRVVAEAPLGWAAVVKMTGGNGTIKISAPRYGQESVPSGDVVLKLYDGSGSFKEKAIRVEAFEDALKFVITDLDLDAVSEFTLGSRTTVHYDCSNSFKNLEFNLPAGWKAIEKSRGTFILIAPDLTVESGDESGTVTVTPVSWGGAKGDDLARSIRVHVDRNKPTFQFVEEETSFAYGETKELEITAKGVKDIIYPATPAGWTIDWTGLMDGTVKVTAPARDAAVAGAGTLILGATSNADQSPISSNPSVIRLYGINTADELLAFRSVYEGVDPDDPETDPAVIGKWLVDGALALNADLDLTSGMLTKSAYIIKYLNVPLEGNGHTLHLDLECNAAVGAVFQYNTADIRNLKVTGSIVNAFEGGVSKTAPLVAEPMTATIENIDCSADVHYKVGASCLVKSGIGGIGAYSRANESPTFKNCTYSGTITLDNDAFAVGGIIGSSDTGKPGGTTTIEGCTFSGAIILNHQIADSGITPRLGGFLGDLARVGVVNDCTSTGTITVNAGGKRVLSSNAGGFGGVVGRITAPASGYTMSSTIKNVTFKGTLQVVNAASNEDKTRYHQILGCSPNANSDAALIKENWSEEGTLIL